MHAPQEPIACLAFQMAIKPRCPIRIRGIADAHDPFLDRSSQRTAIGKLLLSSTTCFSLEWASSSRNTPWSRRHATSRMCKSSSSASDLNGSMTAKPPSVQCTSAPIFVGSTSPATAFSLGQGLSIDTYLSTNQDQLDWTLAVVGKACHPHPQSLARLCS